MYFFAMYTDIDGMTIYYATGLGLIKNMPYLFTNASSIAAGMMLPIAVYYLVLIAFIFMLASPFLILIGIKRRATAIIGSLFVIFLALTMIAGHLLVQLASITMLFDGLYIMWDTWALVSGTPSVQLSGMSLMLIVGVIAFIGGCLGRGPKVEVYKGRTREEAEPTPEEPTVQLPKSPLGLRSLSFPLDYSDLPAETMRPEINVPIDYSKAKEVVPADAEILYSTLMSGVYTFGPLKETWISHILITTRGVAFSRPASIGDIPRVYFTPWDVVSAPLKGRFTIKISALAYYNFKLYRAANYETKESFNLRFKHFGGKFRPLKKAFDKQWKAEKKIFKAERKAEKQRLKEERRRRREE